jgi:hypothetical protein
MGPFETVERTADAPLLRLLTPSAAPSRESTPQMVEREYTLQFGAALDDGVVVKSSESEYYVLVTTGSADNFAKKTRADFIAIPPTPTPSPTLGPGTPTEEQPLISTPSASATPEAAATAEVTEQAVPEATEEVITTPEATEASSGS